MSAFLLLIAGGFISVGTASLMSGGSDVGGVIVAYLVGAFFFALGISWHWAKRAVSEKFAVTLNSVASDFRYWLATLLIIFLYLGYPMFLMSSHTLTLPPHNPEVPQVVSSSPAPKIAAPTLTAPTIEILILTPRSLQDMTNEKLRQTAYLVASRLSSFDNVYSQLKYAAKQAQTDTNSDSLNRLKIDEKESDEFREKFRDAVVNIYKEFSARGVDVDGPIDLSIKDFTHAGIISDLAISRAAARLEFAARDLP